MKEITKQAKEKENWLRRIPTKFTKLLCKLLGHKLRIVGTIGISETLYCGRCGKNIKKFYNN